jgi:hypothetical protein
LLIWLARVVGFGGIAVEHLDRHRAAVGGAEQAVDDLQLALLAVPVVAAPGQGAAVAFQIARRHVVEHQRAAIEAALGQRRLDRRLPGQQPVEGGVELVLADRAETQHLTQAGGGGSQIERLAGRQLGGGRNDPADDQRDGEIAATVAVGSAGGRDRCAARCRARRRRGRVAASG